MQRKIPDDVLLVEIDVNTPPALVVGPAPAAASFASVNNDYLKRKDR